MRCVTCECDVSLAFGPITLEHEVSMKPITAFKMLTITAIAMCLTGCAVLQIPNDLFRSIGNSLNAVSNVGQ